jgi:NAD(P)-dependent dehydrogenase (short-subunit alcohol dehydrogenase family)
MADMKPLAVVTGAAGGIGRAIAQRLARDGRTVAMLDMDKDTVHAAAESVPGAIEVIADVSDETSVNAALDGLPGIATLAVNSAGIVRYGPLAGQTMEEFLAVVQVNLVGTFIVARGVARRLMEADLGGSIVNITSMNGVAPGPNAGAYGATKAGVALLTQQMAIEWGSFGIRVNAVAPGLVDAGMSRRTLADPVVREARQSKVPLARLGNGDDIAAAVSFLASDEAAYITGQNLLVDGGVTMSIIANLPRPKSVDKVGIKE